MTQQRFWSTARSDLRHGTALWDATWSFWPLAISKVLLHPRLRAVVMFRVAHTLWQSRAGKIPALWLPARILRMCGAEIHPAATIGSSFLLVHSAGVAIHPGARIDQEVAMYQGATLGDRDGRSGQPVVGDRVRIESYAVILGPVIVGKDARIGAGAVVLTDVTAGATAIGQRAAIRVPRTA